MGSLRNTLTFQLLAYLKKEEEEKTVTLTVRQGHTHTYMHTDTYAHTCTHSVAFQTFSITDMYTNT